MAQHEQQITGVAPPPPPSQDPWASLSAAEEDLAAAAAAVAPGNADDDVDPFEGEIVDPATDAPDVDATLAADANASAVEAAIIAAQADAAAAPTRGGAFTIPLLCAGVAIIAACLLIPQADANRRLAYERLKLQADLQAVERQVETNDEFLRKLSEDPNLAERLAQRQMKIIRQGNHVLDLKGEGDDDEEMSPFQLTAVPAPAELAPYQSRGGPLASVCYNRRSRLYLMGAGLMAMAAGLVLGFGPAKVD